MYCNTYITFHIKAMIYKIITTVLSKIEMSRYINFTFLCIEQIKIVETCISYRTNIDNIILLFAVNSITDSKLSYIFSIYILFVSDSNIRFIVRSVSDFTSVTLIVKLFKFIVYISFVMIYIITTHQKQYQTRQSSEIMTHCQF